MRRADGIEFVCERGESTGHADGSFDVIVSFETLNRIEDGTGLLGEFFRLLKPEGTLLISTANQWPLKVAPFHLREYDRKSFESLISERFRLVELWNQNSGSDFEYNRRQPRGITATMAENEELAECYIAVAKKPA